ncbi:MAG: aldehyde ferredoxin oxidoreductase C-terminal domain-containing protein, partial [Planctomycetota bacterium]
LLGIEDFSRLLRTTTGIDMNAEILLEVAERALTLERMFNLRAGLTRRDDWIPERFFEPPYGAGAEAAPEAAMDREAFRGLVDGYYERHGWNPNGIPTDLRKRELGLEDESARRL